MRGQTSNGEGERVAGGGVVQADQAGYELRKGLHWILVRNRDEEGKLPKALAAFPELRSAYFLKERFVLIANRLEDRAQAERFLRVWV